MKKHEQKSGQPEQPSKHQQSGQWQKPANQPGQKNISHEKKPFKNI